MLGQKGSKMWSGHKGVKRLLTHLAESGNQELSRSAEQVDALCGNPRAQAVILSRITDPQFSEGERLKSILFTRVLPSDAARSALLDVMSATNSSALSFPALSALEEVGRPESAVELIHRWNTLSDTLKPAVIESLTSRVDWAAALVSGLESRKVSATELSETALALLRIHSNPALQARLKLALQQPVRR